MIYPLVLELAADRFPVAVACRVRGFSTQAFYRWRADPVSQRDRVDAHLKNAAVNLHRGDQTFGYRLIADDLHAAGHRASERWVIGAAGMAAGLAAAAVVVAREEARPESQGRSAGARRRVRRAFTAPDLDKLWLTDITEHPTGIYIAASIRYSAG